MHVIVLQMYIKFHSYMFCSFQVIAILVFCHFQSHDLWPPKNKLVGHHSHTARYMHSKFHENILNTFRDIAITFFHLIFVKLTWHLIFGKNERSYIFPTLPFTCTPSFVKLSWEISVILQEIVFSIFSNNHMTFDLRVNKSTAGRSIIRPKVQEEKPQ